MVVLLSVIFSLVGFEEASQFVNPKNSAFELALNFDMGKKLRATRAASELNQ